MSAILEAEIVRFRSEPVLTTTTVYSPESVDYTDQAALVARKVAAGEYDRGSWFAALASV